MSKLVGENLEKSAVIEKSIESILGEMSKQAQKISEVRSSDQNLVSAAETLYEKINSNRGRPLFYPYVGSGAGRGPFVELIDGSVKLDLINGIGIHILGHSHPRVIEASMRASMSDIVMQGNLQPNREYAELGDKLVNLAKRKSNLRHAWLTTSGSMANEIALKISRQKNAPARKILAMEGAFAGRTTMMTEVGDNVAHSVGQPKYGEVLRVPFYDGKDPQSGEKSLRALKEHVAKNENDISIFGFELIQGEGGFNVAPREFFLPMFDFCKEKGIALWADEVQTFCRTGEFFAFEKLDLGEYLDIVTLAKTVQVGATLYTPEYNPKAGLIAGTFSGSTVSLAAGCEIIDVLSDGYMGNSGRIEKVHQKFMSEFNKLIEGSCKGLLSNPGGIGLMVTVSPFGGNKEKILKLLKPLYNNGLMTFGCGREEYKLRFLVPAIISDEEIEMAVRILEKTILEEA